MKEKVPISILEVLTPSSNENLQFVEAVNEQGTLLVLKAKHPTSNFYFKITKQENRSGGLHYHVELKPKTKEDTASAQHWMTNDRVITTMKSWLALIGAYNTTRSILDDPITKAYEETFADRFKIVEKDAAYAGFDLEQQIYLDDYLNDVRQKVQLLKDGRSESDVADLNEIEAEAVEIQHHLTKESKQKIVRRLSRMWAKAQRVGLDVIKEIFVNIAAELGTRLLTGRLS